MTTEGFQAMTSATVQERDGGQRVPFFGSLSYLLMNLPLGIASFVAVVTLFSVGVPLLLVWVGIPVLAALIFLVRGGAVLERARVYSLLNTYITMPYRPLPASGQKARWKTRLKDGATWRDLLYFVLLFPLGIVEFVLLITFWSVSLGLAFLPVYYRWLPDGVWHFPDSDPDGLHWVTVDSVWSGLPWMAAGLLFAVLSVALTRALGAAHARFAQALLGPASGRLREAESGFGPDSMNTTVAG